MYDSCRSSDFLRCKMLALKETAKMNIGKMNIAEMNIAEGLQSPGLFPQRIPNLLPG